MDIEVVAGFPTSIGPAINMRTLLDIVFVFDVKCGAENVNIARHEQSNS